MKNITIIPHILIDTFCQGRTAVQQIYGFLLIMGKCMLFISPPKTLMISTVSNTNILMKTSNMQETIHRFSGSS